MAPAFSSMLVSPLPESGRRKTSRSSSGAKAAPRCTGGAPAGSLNRPGRKRRRAANAGDGRSAGDADVSAARAKLGTRVGAAGPRHVPDEKTGPAVGFIFTRCQRESEAERA